ncbi:MAG: ATP-binding protein [Rikenellaceae bacterium]
MKNSSHVQITLLVVGIILIMLGACYTIFLKLYSLTAILIFVVIIAGVTVIKRYRATLHKISVMLDAIDNDDLSFRFSTKAKSSSSGSDQLLNQSLNRVKEMVIEAREEAREREKYFETIIEQSNLGVIVANKQGITLQVNSQSLKLLHLARLTHLDQLGKMNSDLPTIFKEIKQGQNRQICFYSDSSEVRLNLYANELYLKGQNTKVLILTDISQNIDKTEVDSWSRISRVLTHEIMNSLAPITSLSKSLLDSNDPEYTHKGLEIIASTADTLIEFVNNYRTLTRVPKPICEDTDIEQLVHQEVALISKDLEIKTETCSSPYMAYVDQNQIKQVVINLLKNGLEATEDIPNSVVWVELSKAPNGAIRLDICNNGSPITDEIREDIFVPFFTTKEGGSGIGLSLSRQIMRLHEGSITLSTQPYTRFRIQFSV